MIDRIVALSRRSTLRSVSILMTGTVGGQLIIALSSPVLTRIYTPDQMGALNVFVSIASPILAFSSLRFNSALQVPEDQEEARSLTHLALASTILISLISFIAVLLFRDNIASFFTTPGLNHYLLLLPVAIIAAGFFTAMSSWGVRVKAFSVIAKARVQQSIVIVTMQISLGLAGLGSWGLLSGDAVGRFFGSASQYRVFRSTAPTRGSVKRDYIALISRYRKFPLYSVPPALMNSVSINLPTYFLAISHGPTSVGLFALGQRVLGLPLNLIAEAVSQVFLSQSSELYRQSVDALESRTRQVCLILMAVGAAIVIPIAALGPWVFGIVFGQEWYDAGVYVRALAPMLWAQFSFSPLSAVLVVLERQDLHALREVVRMILLVGVVVILAAAGITDPAQIVVGFGILGAVSYAFGGALVWHALRKARYEELNHV